MQENVHQRLIVLAFAGVGTKAGHHGTLHNMGVVGAGVHGVAVECHNSEIGHIAYGTRTCSGIFPNLLDSEGNRMTVARLHCDW